MGREAPVGSLLEEVLPRLRPTSLWGDAGEPVDERSLETVG
jgi:hypothetical protein